VVSVQSEVGVNWLTARLADIGSFEYLYQQGTTHVDSSLRRVSFKFVEEVLGADMEPLLGTLALNLLQDGYIYAEDSEAAADRVGRSTTYEGDVPADMWFTTGIADHDGTVLYIPDDESAELNFQLYSGAESGPIQRLIAHVAPVATGPVQPGQIERVAMDPCSDGPCVEWLDECGAPGCRCLKYLALQVRVQTVARSLSRRSHSEGTTVVSSLRCSPW
jgi:hypothetical protein